MKKESKNLILGIIIGVVVIVLIYFIFVSNHSTNTNQEENQIKQIELSKSNFAYIKNFNINSGTANEWCDTLKARDCDALAEYYNLDETNEECYKFFWNFEYRLINMPEEILPSYSEVKCKAYQDGDILKSKIMDLDGKVTYREWENFGSPEGSETQDITFWVDVTKDSDIMLCCEIDGFDITSNEVCLDPISIKSCQSH